MFGKEGHDQQAAISSILGSDCKFTGDVDAKGTIRIDGEFEGKIFSSDSVIVGKSGTVLGEIRAAHAVVSGTVEGNVFAKRKVELESGSRLIGDVESMSLVIEDGVFFEGKILSSDSVIVGKSGTVHGEIRAAHAVVSGTVEGNVFAKRKVELESGSRLIGDVESMSLVIEDGVFFEGKSKMMKEGQAFTEKPAVFQSMEEEEQEVEVQD